MKALVFSDQEELLMQLATLYRDKVECSALTFSQAPELLQEYGFKHILVAKHVQYDARSVATTVLKVLETGYDYFIVGSTVLGREVAAMVAQHKDWNMISEILELNFVNNAVETSRFFYGGKTVIKERSTARVFTVMPGITDPVKAPVSGEIETIDMINEGSVNIVELKNKEKAAVNIEKADILVSVGRGIGKKEGIALIKSLADTVHGELAGSRPVCLDYHWLDEEQQVGLSGKRVKPKLYIAIGISGQIQHIAGMRGSKTVIAINKDKNAPIFAECDYGIVGDLYKVVPLLIDMLKQ